MTGLPDPTPQEWEGTRGDRQEQPEPVGHLETPSPEREGSEPDLTLDQSGQALPSLIEDHLPPEISPPATPASFFESYAQQPLPPPRFPNLLDVLLLGTLLLLGWLVAGGLFFTALRFHLFGVSTVSQALTDIHYTLGSQVTWYLLSFLGCMLLFPAIWHTSFFKGIEWRATAAFRLRWRLLSAAFACFLLAMVDGVLLPGPPDTPIDKAFRMPGAAWFFLAFGVTLAPFFEEMAFRGFLLPACCTAYDWIGERLQGRLPPWPDSEGKTRWSLPAKVVGSVVTSIPFALMHAEQTGYSLGPFLLLICVSLLLCWVRLNTRSVAASTLVHSSYNLLLFSLMLAGTGGFRHLERL